MNTTCTTLRDNGIRVTPQRAEIYKLLNTSQQHLTAEEIYRKIRPRFPAISLATVYTILELFKEKKLFSEIRIEFEKSRYEIRSKEHHHFFCKKCNAIHDLMTM